jgi:hypothetical protein
VTLEANSEVAIINGEWVAVTDWYEPHQKPVRVGWFECSFFDCGWPYEWRVWFDGTVWRDKPGGNSLIDQQQTWRGLTEQTA